jgi:uncharacterized membrane protein YfcA
LTELLPLAPFRRPDPFRGHPPISIRARDPRWRGFSFGAGFALGIIIGLVSSILGVDGGELLIPKMMFIFGADIKTADGQHGRIGLRRDKRSLALLAIWCD